MSLHLNQRDVYPQARQLHLLSAMTNASEFNRQGPLRNKQQKTYHFLSLSVLPAFFFLILIAGCSAVGPDYTAPEDNLPPAWQTELSAGLTAEPLNPEQLACWWATLNDPVLSDIITLAIQNNRDLKQARAKVLEARARRGISKASLFPVLDATGSAGRSKGSASNGGGVTRSFYSLGFDAGWEVDIFGSTRRSVEAAEADLAASREALWEVLVSLTAEAAVNYVEVRTYQARLAVAEQNLSIQQQTYDLARSRLQAGLSNALAVEQARYTLENTRAQIPTLRSGLEEAKNRLTLLTGQFPGGLQDQLHDARPIPVVPPTVAVGVPAETLRQRPDIRKAERSLAAQTARIGVATAELFPQFRLTGSIGLESLKSTQLFRSASQTWNIIPGVSWNVFDAGAIRQNIQVQTAIREQYLFAYESVVLAAVEEVESALVAFIEEQLRREHLVAAVDASRQAEHLARDQYNAGLVDFISVLDAQRSLLSSENQLIESDGTVTANLIRLYKSLGGGWSPGMNSRFSEQVETQ